MIQKMREIAPTIMIVIIIAFVGGTLFLDWGANVMGQRPDTHIGKINGKKIPVEAFNRMVDMERSNRLEQGQDIPQEQLRMIPRYVWNQEVSRTLLAAEVKSMSLQSTVSEVFEYVRRNPLPAIAASPMFMTDGQFDTTKYTQWLARPDTYTRNPWLLEHERFVREVSLPTLKIEALLKAGVFVSPSEIMFEHSQRHKKATFEFFKAENFHFSPTDSTPVSESMINEYYAANKKRFTQAEQADLYFIRIPKVATEDDLAANKKKLLDMKARIESGETTFEAEAEAESDDLGSATNGGDLGWFGKGSMVQEFEAMAFSIDTGIISEPVKSKFGYHIIRVEEREVDDSTGETRRVKARHILLNDKPSIATIEALSGKAEEIKRQLVDKNFAEVAAAIAADDASVTFDSTGLFTIGDLPPKIGYLYGAGVFAFGRRIGETVSDPLDSEQNIFILGIKEKTKKGVQPLEIVRGQIEIELRDTVAAGGAREQARAIRERVMAGATVDDIKASYPNVVAGMATDQAVLAYQSQLGYASKAISVAMDMPAGAVSDVIEDRGGFAVVRVIKAAEMPEPTAENLAIARQNIIQGIMQMVSRDEMPLYNEWFAYVRENAKIEDNVNTFYLD